MHDESVIIPAAISTDTGGGTGKPREVKSAKRSRSRNCMSGDEKEKNPPGVEKKQNGFRLEGVLYFEFF